MRKSNGINNRKLRSVAFALSLLLLFSLLPGCVGQEAKANTGQGEIVTFTDSCGREVELPKEITRIAPSGVVATMILDTIAPEYMVCISNTPSSEQFKYLPDNLVKLPTTGQLYGSKSTINLESLLSADPQVIIDLGDPKEGIEKDMDAVQKQTGVPTIFIQADLPNMAQAYRTLGEILSGKEERGEELAAFIDETMTMAAENKAKISEEDRISVMYTSGTSGLNSNAKGSVQSQVMDLVGAENAIVVNEISNKGGGNTVSLEQLYLFDPDMILFTTGSVYSSVSEDPAWMRLKAISSDAYYEIPGMPYNWMSNPPSINMVLGIWWFGNLLYPDVYSYDMKEKAKEMYLLFWNYQLSEEEANAMLQNSIIKRNNQGGGE